MFGHFASKFTGQAKAVCAGDPLYCTLDKCRVRFVRMVDSSSVEVSDDYTGKPLPDYRHPSQLFSY